MIVSLGYLSDLSSYILPAVLSTVAYSMLIPMIPQSHFGVICHKCISHVPSTILIVVATNIDSVHRSLFMILSSVQYLGLWLEMYSEVFTMQLKQQISTKTGPSLLSELLYAAHDIFIILHSAQLSQLIPSNTNLDLAYKAGFVFFIMRNLLNLVSLLQAVWSIVELEPKKKN